MRGCDIAGMIIHGIKPKYWEKSLRQCHCDAPFTFSVLKRLNMYQGRIQTKKKSCTMPLFFAGSRSTLPLSRAFVTLRCFSPGACALLIAGYILLLSSVRSHYFTMDTIVPLSFLLLYKLENGGVTFAG
jgi:hypothetical protein